MKTTSPTFSERRAKLEAIAGELSEIATTLAAHAEFLADEASRMRAIEARYAEQSQAKKAARLSRAASAS